MSRIRTPCKMQHEQANCTHHAAAIAAAGAAAAYTHSHLEIDFLSEAAATCRVSLTLLSCAPAFRSASSPFSAAAALFLDAMACAVRASRLVG